MWDSSIKQVSGAGGQLQSTLTEQSCWDGFLKNRELKLTTP
jgi:hypothetical protein